MDISGNFNLYMVFVFHTDRIYFKSTVYVVSSTNYVIHGDSNPARVNFRCSGRYRSPCAVGPLAPHYHSCVNISYMG